MWFACNVTPVYFRLTINYMKKTLLKKSNNADFLLIAYNKDAVGEGGQVVSEGRINYLVVDLEI